MPEGPELHMNSLFVNRVCKRRLFRGKIVKSAVSKCCDVDFSSAAYCISSQARGKELALTLRCTQDPRNSLRLLFRFGMSGKFRFGAASELPKHAHLQFFTWTASPSEGEGGGEEKEGKELASPNVLSFVDMRRFGTWRVAPAGWGEERGPDPMFEYETFRQGVRQGLCDSAFNRPLCETLLNQKYFNGIGNYLRAEIVFRAKVPPFKCARDVLQPLFEDGATPQDTDLIWLCHKVPLEVVQMKKNLDKVESTAVTQGDYLSFCQWLQCYEKPGIKNLRDHNGRTMWFQGEAGPMVPKIQKSRKARRGSGQAQKSVSSKNGRTGKGGGRKEGEKGGELEEETVAKDEEREEKRAKVKMKDEEVERGGYKNRWKRERDEVDITPAKNQEPEPADAEDALESQPKAKRFRKTTKTNSEDTPTVGRNGRRKRRGGVFPSSTPIRRSSRIVNTTNARLKTTKYKHPIN